MDLSFTHAALLSKSLPLDKGTSLIKASYEVRFIMAKLSEPTEDESAADSRDAQAFSAQQMIAARRRHPRFAVADDRQCP